MSIGFLRLCSVVEPGLHKIERRIAIPAAKITLAGTLANASGSREEICLWRPAFTILRDT